MAVTLPTNPYANPAYLAFLRAQGLEESDAVGEAQTRISALRRGLNMRLPDYAEGEKRGLESVGEDFENRGLFRSGARLVAQQRVSDDQQKAKLGDIAGVQDEVAQTSAALARSVAGLRRARAEQELSYRTGNGAANG